MPSRLTTKIAGLRLTNPTILAGGILGTSGLTLKRAAIAGAGAVVTKSTGLNARPGYDNPTIVQVEGGLVNAIGLANPGIDEFVREILETKGINVPIIISIYGSSPQEFAVAAKKATKGNISALELNLSCPHAACAGAEIGQDGESVKEVVKEVKEHVQIPVFAKLTSNLPNITEIAKAAEEAGADAITAINTLKAMVINIETAKPVLGNKIGGLSGSAIKPVAVRCVYEIYETVDIPIIGCGGICTWQDAVEFMLAGASAIQIGTAIATKGLGVFRRITEGIDVFLEKKGLGSVREIVGLSHRE